MSSKRITVSLPEDLVDGLDTMAAEEHRSRGAMVWVLLDEALQHRRNQTATAGRAVST